MAVKQLFIVILPTLASAVQTLPNLSAMRLAIATHEGRVSPVLDVALRLVVVDVDGKEPSARREVLLTGKSLPARVRDIQAAAVDVLICGAVSWPLEAALLAAGVHVVPQVCGNIDEVLGAYLAGRLTHGAFLMPGCCGRRHRGGGRVGGQGSGGRGMGRGRGAGGGMGRSRGGGGR